MVALNFGIIIQARTSSTRYPEKILKKIDKVNTVLDFQIKRVLKEFENKYVFIATTLKKKDKSICLIAKKNNVNFFRGSEKSDLLLGLPSTILIITIILGLLEDD